MQGFWPRACSTKVRLRARVFGEWFGGSRDCQAFFDMGPVVIRVFSDAGGLFHSILLSGMQACGLLPRKVIADSCNPAS